MKFAHVCTKVPRYFQEVHPWNVNILGLSVPWDSLSEMGCVCARDLCGGGACGQGLQARKRTHGPWLLLLPTCGLGQVVPSP